MPTSLSAKKRLRQNANHRLQNMSRKSDLRTRERQFLAKIEEKDADGARKLYIELASRYDRAARHNVVHRNKANRKKSRLAAMLSTIEK